MTHYKKTFEDLEKDPWWQKMIQHVGRLHGDPIPNVYKEILVHVANNSSTPNQQVLQWLVRFNKVCQLILSKQARISDFAWFWIGLFEILESLTEYYKKFNEMGIHVEVYKQLNLIRDLHSDEELIVIEYERHCRAHIFQDGYKPQAKYNNGKLTEDGLLRKGRSKKDIDNIIVEHLKKYHIDEELMALDFAGRYKNEIEVLIVLIKKQYDFLSKK